MFVLSGAVGALIRALHPAWWAVLYQLPLAFGIAYLVARQQARPEIPASNITRFAAIAGLGGPLVFLLLMTISISLLTALLSIAIMWVGVSFALDKYLDVDWESSQRITGLVCVPIWLAWLIIGGIIIAVR